MNILSIQPSIPTRAIEALRKIPLKYIGFSLILAWIGALEALPSRLQPDWHYQDLVWVITGLSAAALALTLGRKPLNPSMASITNLISGTLCTVCSVSLLAPDTIPADAQIVALIIGSVAASWLLLRWGEVVSRFSYNALLRIMAANALSLILLKTAFQAYGNTSIAESIAIISLPMLSFICLKRAGKTLKSKSSGQIFYPKSQHKALLFIALLVGLFSLMLNIVDLLTISYEPSPVSQTVKILFSILLLLYLVTSNRRLDFSGTVQFLLLSIALTSFAFSATQSFLQAGVFGFGQAIRELARFYLFIIAADIAHHSDESPITVFGVCWLLCALCKMPFLLFSESFKNIQFSDGGFASFCISLLLLTIIFIMAFSILKPQPDFRAPLSDPRTHPRNTKFETSSIDTFTKYLEAQCGLTAREIEVALLLCHGRSKTYIAETLYLSENTVKYHARNIYRKTGIKSKDELISLYETCSKGSDMSQPHGSE